MKIVFCDIDGVLNSAYYTTHGGGGIVAVEKRKVQNLKKIMDATDAKAVIISRANSLFKSFSQQRLADIRSFGVEPFDSITDFEFQESKEPAIRRWLKKHPEVTNYVILDDVAADLPREFGTRFIHIKTKHGLTYNHVAKAIEALNL